ncbi:MAG: bifunctional nuclease family protein [Muribaculaceae bacterium]|nr:bifunctional nuclease family protein [Muribaculaceae bacterium]
MNADEKIRLEVVGVTYNQISNGAYALVLQEAGSTRRLSIVIGLAEAHSIFVRLQDLTPPRPLTHDLMVSLMRSHGIKLKEVCIDRYVDGMFMSEVIVTAPDGKETRIDSRTSDAVALALRTDAPIYTTPQVMEATSRDVEALVAKALEGGTKKRVKLEERPLEELHALLERAVAQERYEQAAKIQKIIQQKTSQTSDDTHGNEE